MRDDLLELLRQRNPVDPDAVPTPSPESLRMISDTRTDEPVLKRRRARWIAPGAVATAAAIVTAIVIVAASLPGGGGSASSEATTALKSVAAIASAQASPAESSGYTYYRLGSVSRGTIPAKEHPYSWYRATTIEEWVAPDGSGRLRESEAKIEWPGPRDEERWRSQGAPQLPTGGPTIDREHGPGELDGTPSEGALPPVRELPPDPEELIAIFSDEAAASSESVPTNVKLFEYATSVLLQRGSAPELRAALYEALMQIEGVELVGHARDPLGRSGRSVAITSDYKGGPVRYALVFDSETSYPLAYTERALEPQDWIDSQTLGYVVLAESGHVDDTHTRPGDSP